MPNRFSVKQRPEKMQCLRTEQINVYSFVLQVNAINYALLPLLSFVVLHTLFVSRIVQCHFFSVISLAMNKTLFSRIISLFFFLVLFSFSSFLSCCCGVIATSSIRHSMWPGAHKRTFQMERRIEFSCVNINS